MEHKTKSPVGKLQAAGAVAQTTVPTTCRLTTWELYFGVHSAGLLLYRHQHGTLQVLLVHPGGPYWARKDQGAWSIPKGEIGPDEAPEDAARREFTEETGQAAAGDLVPLGSIKQRGGKTVHAWALAGDCDPATLKSNTFEMEWPPRSGRMQEFPEIDRAGWFTMAEAREKMVEGQRELLDRFETVVGP